jgi:hypothetical protein
MALVYVYPLISTSGRLIRLQGVEFDVRHFDVVVPAPYTVAECTRLFLFSISAVSSEFSPLVPECSEWFQLHKDCTFWIRRSTGQLCVDLVPSRTEHWFYQNARILNTGTSINELNKEAMVIDYLAVEQYHAICYWYLSESSRIIISPSATMNLGALISGSSGNLLEDLVEIATLPDIDFYPDDQWHSRRVEAKVMKHGWTRYVVSTIRFLVLIVLNLKVTTPEMYQTEISGYRCATKTQTLGSFKRIAFSASSGSIPISRIMVHLFNLTLKPLTCLTSCCGRD